MEIKINTKKYEVHEDVVKRVKERIVEKVEGLTKFFKDEASAKVNVATVNKQTKIEATIHVGGLAIRTENSHVDPIASVDEMSSLLHKRIVRNKTKLHKGLNKSIKNLPADFFSVDTSDADEEKEYTLIKKKKFDLKPMSVDEAILQMNLIGHDFFVFKDTVSDATNIVYKRKNGGYGIIES